MFNLKCIECGTDFKADRKDARFHTDACRKRYSRKSTTKTDSETEITIKRKIPVINDNTDMDRVMAEINKKYGAGTAFYASDMPKIERLSTGIPVLDEKLGGGLPKRRIVELYGQPMAGKSLISLLTIAKAQSEGKKCVYFDCEGTFDLEWAKKLGVDTAKLSLVQNPVGEDIFEALFKYLEGKSDIIVVDSVDAIVTRAEFEEDVEKAFMAIKARLMSKAMRMIIPKNKNTLIIFINQLRSTMTMYGPKFTTPGGLALKFYSSIRLEVKKIEDIHLDGKKTTEPIGQIVGFKVTKNKTATPFQTGSFKFYYDGHIE